MEEQTLDEQCRAKQLLYERSVHQLRSYDMGSLTKICKMHLSFLLDMDNERFEELFGCDSRVDLKSKRSQTRLKRKSSRKTNVANCSNITDDVIPIRCKVEKLMVYLEQEENMCHEGLFRKTGNISRQRELREKLDTNADLSIDDQTYTAHDCASVLKTVLGELPEPLLSERMFDAYLYTLGIEDTRQRIKVINLLIQLLPSPNFIMCKKLFSLLHRVTSLSKENKMTADNLGAVFAPHLLCPRQFTADDLHSVAAQIQSVVSFIITHTDDVFRVPQMLALDAMNRVRKRSAADISSMSEESLLSVDFVDGDSVLLPTNSGEMADDDDPVDTIVSFTQRDCGNAGEDKDVQLAKLYAHVQSMPDSTKKRKLIKQFSEAHGYHQQVQEKKRRTRSRSLSQSIKRRFSYRRRQKSLNVTTESVDQPENRENELIVEPITVMSVTPVKPEAGSSEQNDSLLVIPSFSQSPYCLHQTSLKVLRRGLAESAGEADVSSGQSVANSRSRVLPTSQRPEPEGAELCATVRKSHVPDMRKALLPVNASRLTGKKSQAIRAANEHQDTPPRPKRGLSVRDSGIRV